jgi:LPXTG-motif cell wall-anchored protein
MKELKAELTMDETGAKTAAEEEAAPSGESVASSSAPEEKVEIREGKGKKEGLTASPYFWPAVGAGVLALGVGGYFLLRKKE